MASNRTESVAVPSVLPAPTTASRSESMAVFVRRSSGASKLVNWGGNTAATAGATASSSTGIPMDGSLCRPSASDTCTATPAPSARSATAVPMSVSRCLQRTFHSARLVCSASGTG